MDRISQGLTQRVKELAERYETSMPRLTNRVAELEAKVNRHLEKMGFSYGLVVPIERAAVVVRFGAQFV
jgi:hypothetical protein